MEYQPMTYAVTFFYMTMDGRESAKQLIVWGEDKKSALKNAVRLCKRGRPYVLESLIGWAIDEGDIALYHIIPQHRGTVLDMLM